MDSVEWPRWHGQHGYGSWQGDPSNKKTMSWKNFRIWYMCNSWYTHTHTHVSVYVCLSTVHWSRTPEGIKSSGVQVPHIKWDSTCIWFRSKGKLDSLSQEWRGTRLYSREHAFPARLWARLLYRVSSVGKGGTSREAGAALGSGSSAGGSLSAILDCTVPSRFCACPPSWGVGAAILP